jgi:hypothetical protein
MARFIFDKMDISAKNQDLMHLTSSDDYAVYNLVAARVPLVQ